MDDFMGFNRDDGMLFKKKKIEMMGWRLLVLDSNNY